jgi:hypothetical protein
VRAHVSASAALAECQASLLNARLVADAAGLALDSVPAAGALVAASASSGAALPASASVAAAQPPTGVPALRRAFLDHHEKVITFNL